MVGLDSFFGDGSPLDFSSVFDGLDSFTSSAVKQPTTSGSWLDGLFGGSSNDSNSNDKSWGSGLWDSVKDFATDKNVVQGLITGGLGVYQSGVAQDQADQEMQLQEKARQDNLNMERFKIYSELAKLRHLSGRGGGGSGGGSAVNRNAEIINALNTGTAAQIQALSNFATNYTNAFK